MGNHETRHDSPRSSRDVLSKKCQRIHKTRQNKKRSHKKRIRDPWNTRHEIQIQTKLDQPSWKNWTTPDFWNTPSTVNLEEEEIVDAPRNDGNAARLEQVKQPNPWRKMMMKSESITWGCRVPLASSERVNLYNGLKMILSTKTKTLAMQSCPRPPTGLVIHFSFPTLLSALLIHM